MSVLQKSEPGGRKGRNCGSAGFLGIRRARDGRFQLTQVGAVRAAVEPVEGPAGKVPPAVVSRDLLNKLSGELPFKPPIAPPHLLDISRIDGSPWVNPAFNTSDPNWASNVLGGQGYDGTSAHPLEWVSVLNPTVEQDDEVAACGTALAPDVSGNSAVFVAPYPDVPFVHPFGTDFEFSVALDPAHVPLLAAGNLAAPNTDPHAPYHDAWPAAQALGLNPTGVLGLEIDGPLVPLVDRPMNGDRVAIYGRWIIDAGHVPFHTEIHPPLLMAYARTLDVHGNSVAPSIDAITHMQLWSRPYQAQQKFSSGGSTGLCLQNYIKAITETVRGISAYPPIFAKAFDGVHLVAFTVRPPVPPPVPAGPTGVEIPQRRLECSYHFTVNGACGVEVFPSPADSNSALLVLALNSAGYPSLGEPPSNMQNLSINELLNEAEKDGAKISGFESAFFWLKKLQLSDHIAFRFFDAPATSALDAVNVVPFTSLATLPRQTVSTDPKSPFPIRGWLKLAWVDTNLVSSTGDSGVGTLFDLTGDWTSGGKVGPKISRSGNSLTVEMSAYNRPQALGSVIDANTITVSFPDVATYTGHLQPPGTIAWSNGSSWTKA